MQQEVVWYTNWKVASSEAKRQGKLLFVLFVCARPSALTQQLLELADPSLKRALLERFLPVRFTSLKGIDLNLFRFDYDLAVAGLVMTPQGTTLARWGGENASVAQLVGLLKRVRTNGATEASTPTAQDLLQKFPRYAQQRAAGQPCFHCHYAHDAEILERQARGLFTKAMLFRYPPAQSLGVVLDPVAGNRVRETLPRSAAARAGVQPGDSVLAANGVPIYTEADLRFALDRLADLGSTALLLVQRGKTTLALSLKLPAGWRTYDLSWRPSQGAISPILGFWEEPIPGRKTLALRITILFPGEKWRASQGELQVGDVIVAVDGKTLPAMTARQFHSWFRLNKQVGETAHLTVVREGRRRDVSIPCLDLRLD